MLLDPVFTGSNPAKGSGFLRAIKICSMPFFRGKVRPSTPCKIDSMLENPSKY
jgi:hypothetical protein